jgi:DNA-binding NtrC family response regulator
LPQTEDAVVEERKSSDTSIPHGHGETILLVDDDRQLVLLGEEMLAAIGYEPVGFHSSPAALAAFRADPDRFDLVVTDEIMPEMSGTELASAMQGIRSGLPVVLMTGYAGNVRPHQFQAASVRAVLRKPLRSASLALCLARHLSRRRDVPAGSDLT